jgi:hypothetical protein
MDQSLPPIHSLLWRLLVLYARRLYCMALVIGGFFLQALQWWTLAYIAVITALYAAASTSRVREAACRDPNRGDAS